MAEISVFKCFIWIVLMGSITITDSRHTHRVEKLRDDEFPIFSPKRPIDKKPVNLFKKNNVMLGGVQSFGAVLREMDKALKGDNTPCTMYDPKPPKFEAKGRRKSEIKCLEHIWYMKTKEEMDKRVEICHKIYKKQFTGIVGGKKPKPGEFPHMGALGWEIKTGVYDFKCGVFLVDEKHALTAAHCEYDPKTNKTAKIVRFGVVNIKNITANEDQPPVDIEINRFIRHPSYNLSRKYNDIAVIELKQKVSFNENIQPICIINQQSHEATISGWGFTNNEAKHISEDLQVATVDVLPQKNCSDKWWPKYTEAWGEFTDSQMCATKLNGVADTCEGDSGSPLQAKLYVNTNVPMYNAIGITSFNDQCGSQRFPTVYTRISSFIDWIEEQVWEVKPNSYKRERVLNIKSVHNFTQGHLFGFSSNESWAHWAFINNNHLQIG